MEKNIKDVIEKYELQKRRLVLAVSGGVDSVTVLDLFARSLPKENLIVAHLNHGIRKESGRDQKFVENLALEYGLKFVTKKVTLKTKSEDEARRVRYQFLKDVLEDSNGSYIITGHNLNDQAETMILNLTRGVGPIEFWGMSELAGEVLRPLLKIERKEIERYVKKQKLKYVFDTTNKDLNYSRNLIRAKVLPELEKLNPKFLDAVRRNTQLGEEGTQVLENDIRVAEKKVKAGQTIDLVSFKKLPLFIQKEIIKRALQEMMGKKEGIYSKNVAAVLDITQKNGNKKTEIGGFTITKNYDKIIFGSKEKKGQKRAKIEVGREISFNGMCFSAVISKGSPTKNNILLPTDMSYNLNIRTWKTGDRIKTSSGTKKIQDIFTDAKIPVSKRAQWPIVVKGDEVIWIPRLAASNFAQRDKNIKFLVIEVKDEK